MALIPCSAKKESPGHSFTVRNSANPAVSHELSIPVSSRHSIPTCTCGGYCPSCHQEMPLQAKLRVNAPGDKYEQEADRVADRVVEGRKIEHGSLSSSPALQRQPLSEGESEEEEEVTVGNLVMSKVNAMPNDGDVAAITPELDGLTGKGRYIPADVRSEFEGLIGKDFSHVRIHTDSQAASLSTRLNARAFTLGEHIVFSHGQYQPTTYEGRHLLAHELAHVVQQAGAGARGANSPIRKTTTGGGTIQREPEKKNCRLVALSERELSIVKGDFGIAPRYVKKAKDIMSAGNMHLPKIKRALKCYFNLDSYTDGFRKKVLENIIKIEKAVLHYAGGHFLRKIVPDQCCKTEKGEAIAMTGKAQLDDEGKFVVTPTMKICDTYFKDRTQTQRIKTLIHECAHVMGIAPGKPEDELYVHDEGFMLVKSSRLLYTADSHACLVMALAHDDWPRCTKGSVSVGAETGVIGSLAAKGKAGWYLSIHVDTVSNTPVLRFFYPYRRFAFTMMATPARQPKPNVSGLQADLTYMAELSSGWRIKHRKSPAGLSWYFSFGGGPLVVINGIPDKDGKIKRISGGLKATIAAGVRFKNLEVKTNLSYLFLPGVPGLRHSLQGGLTLSYRH